MRLIAVTMIKNEADIVEAFVRHNLAFVDRLVVIEHGSTDSTLSILESLRAEGLPLEILRDPALSYQQANRMTATLREAMPRLGADYAFALDADEFIRAPSRAALEHALGAHGDSPVLLLPWSLYLVPEQGSDEIHALRRLSLRVQLPRGGMFKVIVRRDFAEHRDWVLAAGSHHVLAVNGDDVVEIEGAHLPDIELAHLPFRSPGQFLSKVILGWFGNRLFQGGGAHSSPINWHWRELFYAFLEGATPSYADLQERALEWYALKPTPGMAPIDRSEVALIEDPVPHAFELRYTPATASDPLRLLAHWTDRFLDTVRPT